VLSGFIVTKTIKPFCCISDKYLYIGFKNTGIILIISLIFNVLFGTMTAFVAFELMQLYIYRQFISSISVSLDEAALLDGYSYFTLYGRIIFPLLAPARATVCIIKAINIINDMYIPYLYMPKNRLRTLTTF